MCQTADLPPLGLLDLKVLDSNFLLQTIISHVCELHSVPASKTSGLFRPGLEFSASSNEFQ